MSQRAPNFELPRQIERWLAALSKLYAQDGKRQLQEILVNAQTRVVEGWSADNWNGGTYGHALYLVVPEALFLKAAKSRKDLQNTIKQDLNNIHNVQNEFVEEVFLEFESGHDQEWRKNSGLLLSSARVVSASATSRIWQDGLFRVFLSHKAAVKKNTAELKKGLLLYGISSFVAHADIRPTKQWQDEIENALSTMDAFVALLTEDFHDSDWTDQEVGFAVARGVPVIAVKLGRNPYGFIGKFQALACSWSAAVKLIPRLLIPNTRMVNAYIRAVHQCSSFDEGNLLAELLPEIEALDDNQADALVTAFNENPQVQGSFGFNGEKPSKFGLGLRHHLGRLNERIYTTTNDGLIKVKRK
jgi:hypothetical protein